MDRREEEADDPNLVTYEELAERPESVASRVLDFLGLEAVAPLVVPAELTPQADAVSEEWTARYRELAGL